MIRFENVTKIYESPFTKVLEGFSVYIRPKTFAVITGESGSGKTTLLSLLMKEEEVSSGRIIVDGKSIQEISAKRIPEYRRNLGIIFQDFRLIRDINAFENAALAGVLCGGRNKDIERRIIAIFSMLGITELSKRKPEEMSGGEQQKVCLARALVNQPKILLADEPTGNLDPEASKEIFALLRLINQQGVTVVLATHDTKQLEGMEIQRIEL